MDQTLPAECREPLRDLLIACADTKLLMGYHYGEWTFGAPMIESAVAHCSLAQGELGHVRLLHGILKAHFAVDPDFLVEQRPAAQFASVPYLDRALPTWESVVAMTLVVDLAITHVIASIRDSTFAPMRSCAAKLMEEERYHLQHGRGWLRTLAGQPHSRQAVAAAIVVACADVHEWFGPGATPGDRALVAAGVKAGTDQAILQDVFGEIQAMTTSASVDTSRMAAAAPVFEGWTPARRRGRAASPSDEVLYHLRGTKNAVFKVA
jgi:ring-1,2-phenylacetyl-CoA epoxidase subunit PaaC